MTTRVRPIAEQRRDQMFPIFDAAEIARLRPFGTVRAHEKGAYLARIGEAPPGLQLILSGEVDLSGHDALGGAEAISTQGQGAFLAELSVLSSSPSLVDAIATSAVETVLIPRRKLRELMIEEAELGERIMRALILRRVALIESRHAGPVIVGRSGEADVLRLSNFLMRNGQPHRHLDAATDEMAQALIERFHVRAPDLPIVLCPSGQLLRNPREDALARCLGMLKPLDPTALYDVAIVGAGPAGLAAAVYASSEGLSVIMLDCRSFGGQAGASMRIENYLGFPTGISGLALTARAFNQAQKFGVEMSIPAEIARLSSSPGPENAFLLGTKDGETLRARAVIIASGARYRRLAIENLAAFEGAHVHYWASPMEGTLCAGEEVALVGAGNSAGQAAVYLATQAKKVHLLARRESLDATMSRYLVERIGAQRNIEVHTGTEVVGLEGVAGTLETVLWRHRGTGETTRSAIGHLFLFIGADPNTDWLGTCGIAMDEKGFVLTRTGFDHGTRPFETNRAGVFAIGDVRAGSIKRVAAAVGEGAQVVSAIHAYLSSPAA